MIRIGGSNPSIRNCDFPWAIGSIATPPNIYANSSRRTAKRRRTVASLSLSLTMSNFIAAMFRLLRFRSYPIYIYASRFTHTQCNCFMPADELCIWRMSRQPLLWFGWPKESCLEWDSIIIPKVSLFEFSSPKATLFRAYIILTNNYTL